MDYKEKYEHALSVAKETYQSQPMYREWLEKMFSELSGSEDERIRKELIEHIKANNEADYVLFKKFTPDDVLAWLEKQGEQKIDDDDKAILENWEGIVKDNKEKWQLSDWFVEATLLLVQKIKQIGLSKSIVDNNKTMLNACINTLRNVGHSHLAAWLEKQGGIDNCPLEGSVNCVTTDSRKQGRKDSEIKDYNSIDPHFGKSIDKIEPKFKVGDFIANDYCRGKIIKITDDAYLLDTGQGIPFSCEHNAHLWTIQDAKDGDVLICNEEILLFRSYSVQGRISLYCWYNGQTNNFHSKEVNDVSLTTRNKICPATKEQRDILFQQMKKAGYEWNAEKKKLEDIDNEEVNGEDYGIDGLWHAQRILKETLGSVEGYQSDDGILEHKAAITAVSKLSEQKPAWSAEDDRILYNVKAYIGYAAGQRGVRDELFKEANEWLNSLPIGFVYNKNYNEDMVTLLVGELEQIANANNAPEQYRVEINWLKSLRPQKQWKPSEGDIIILEKLIKGELEPKVFQATLQGILEQLKKLKEGKV